MRWLTSPANNDRSKLLKCCTTAVIDIEQLHFSRTHTGERCKTEAGETHKHSSELRPWGTLAPRNICIIGLHHKQIAICKGVICHGNKLNCTSKVQRGIHTIYGHTSSRSMKFYRSSNDGKTFLELWAAYNQLLYSCRLPQVVAYHSMVYWQGGQA